MTPDLVRYPLHFNNTTKPIISFMQQNPRRPALLFRTEPVVQGPPQVESWFNHEQQQRQCSLPDRGLQVSLQIYRSFAMPTNRTNQPKPIQMPKPEARSRPWSPFSGFPQREPWKPGRENGSRHDANTEWKWSTADHAIISRFALQPPFS